jgi:two-component system, OmpR family, phosphate regulon sensor histidine kinase PhoR
MTRTLRADLRLAFGVLLGALVLVGTGGVVATTVTAAYVEQATTTVAPAIHANDAVMQTMTDLETGLRGYVISGRPDALEPYRRGLVRLPAQRARLRGLLVQEPQEPQERRQFAAQAAAIDAWLHRYAIPRVQAPVGAGTFERARFGLGKRLFDDFRAANGATREHLEAHLRDLEAKSDNLRVLGTAGVIVLTLAGLAVGAVTTRFTSRRVRRPLAALRDVLTDLIAGRHDARAEPVGPAEVVTIARSVNALADETVRLREIEAEERRLQERLLEFGREVRSSLEPVEVIHRGLAELGDTLRLGRAYVRLVEDERLQGLGHQWSAPGVDDLVDLATPGSISALEAIHKRRRPLVSTDVRADAFYDTERGRQWVERTGARASVTLPIPVDEVPVGVITCIAFEPREWTGAEIRLAESVAADLGRALEHAKLYTAQVEAVRRLEALDRAKDEFLSSVSHELRTPLTSINGYVELLEDEDADPPSAQQRRLLTVVRRNVDRLGALIEDLLTLSRIESGAFRTTFEPVDLAELVRAGVADLRPQAEQGGIDVHVEVPGQPVLVEGDPGQLARVVLNVLGNAIKFTPARGRVYVALRVEEPPEPVLLEIADSGIGIPESDLDHVASRFFRAGNAVVAGVPGTGLGLVIVRTILDNHAGSLELASREGEGTTVRMRLPYFRNGREPQPSGIATGRGSL